MGPPSPRGDRPCRHRHRDRDTGLREIERICVYAGHLAARDRYGVDRAAAARDRQRAGRRRDARGRGSAGRRYRGGGPREWLRADDARAGWLDFELSRHRALAALDDAAAQLSKVMPNSRRFATARLRGVAYGINGEDERAGDDGPFD